MERDPRMMIMTMIEQVQFRGGENSFLCIYWRSCSIERRNMNAFLSFSSLMYYLGINCRGQQDHGKTFHRQHNCCLMFTKYSISDFTLVILKHRVLVVAPFSTYALYRLILTVLKTRPAQVWT